MFFKKNKQIQELKKTDTVTEYMFLEKPASYWIEIQCKLKTVDIGNLLPDCVMENIELKKENVKLKCENDLLSGALDKIINEARAK